MVDLAPIIAAIGDDNGARPVPPAVQAVAAAARAQFPGLVGVLFYGSCLRDGVTHGRLVDLYLVAESYAAVHGPGVAARLNALIPPNVYYLETAFGGETVRAKAALVSLDQLERLVTAETDNPYFWARFAQPTAIVWARDADVAARIERLLGCAVTTLASEARPLAGVTPGAVELFVRAFQATYRTELRAEPPSRAAALVEAHAERYQRLGEMLLSQLPVPDAPAIEQAERRWRRRRRLGKLWSVARLIKAGFTFDGGADYLAYKIERHSGVRIALTPWQRRHPVLAGLLLFRRLRQRGGFR